LVDVLAMKVSGQLVRRLEVSQEYAGKETAKGKGEAAQQSIDGIYGKGDGRVGKTS